MNCLVNIIAEEVCLDFVKHVNTEDENAVQLAVKYVGKHLVPAALKVTLRNLLLCYFSMCSVHRLHDLCFIMVK